VWSPGRAGHAGDAGEGSELGATTVDGEINVIDVGGVIRGKKRHGFGDFIRRSEPLHRDRREQALVDLLNRFFG
jgi:hypothetical protein